jgi:uncharacterized protein involved in cysteine biosynthesis
MLVVLTKSSATNVTFSKLTSDLVTVPELLLIIVPSTAVTFTLYR